MKQQQADKFKHYKGYTNIIASSIVFIGSLCIVIRDIKDDAHVSGQVWPFAIFLLLALFGHVLFLMTHVEENLIVSFVFLFLSWLISIVCMASFNQFSSTAVLQYLSFMPSFIILCLICSLLHYQCQQQQQPQPQQQQQGQYGPLVIELAEDVRRPVV